MKRLLRELNIDDDWYGFCLLGDNHFINRNIYTIFTSIFILFFIYTLYLIKKSGKNKVIPINIRHFNEEKKTHIDINNYPLDPYFYDDNDDLSKPASPVYRRVFSHTILKPQSPSNNYTILKQQSPRNNQLNDFWEHNLQSYSCDSV
jgi:hypothetical protein